MKKLKRLIQTHIDLDGAACAVILDYFDLEYDELLFVNYSDYESGELNYEYLKQFEEVWYTDFSPDEMSLNIFKKEATKVKIFDHHQTFQDSFKDYDKTGLNYEYYFDNSRSGTEIVFDYLRKGKRIPKNVVDFVQLVSAYDLWKETSKLFEKASDLNRLLWKSLDYQAKGAYKYYPFIEKFVNRLIVKSNSFEFSKSELALISQERKKELAIANESMRKMLIRTDKKGKKFGIIRLRRKVSIVSHLILGAKKGKLDYIIVINEYDKNDLRISLRSKGFNLLDLNYTAGHENACGLNDFESEWIEQLWEGNRMYELGYRDENNS